MRMRVPSIRFRSRLENTARLSPAPCVKINPKSKIPFDRLMALRK